MTNRKEKRPLRNSRKPAGEPRRWSDDPFWSSSPEAECLLAEVKRVGERSGCDGTGRGGLLGYLRELARRRPDAYVALLATCLDDPPVVSARRNREELAELYAKHGFSKEMGYFLWDESVSRGLLVVKKRWD